MKISELIAALEKQRAEHGDIPCVYDSWMGWAGVDEVKALTTDDSDIVHAADQEAGTVTVAHIL